MNKHLTKLFVALIAACPLANALAQDFDSGSDGSYGAMNITANTTLNLPSNGVFNCTTINVATGVTLKFNRNPLNTPVYLLAKSNVTISGTIDVGGRPGTQSPPVGGQGGPGGFDGGSPGFDILPPGAGYGPGGGRGGSESTSPNGVGSGSYATVGQHSNSTNRGAAYGNALVVPLIGGSGGGGIVGTAGVAGRGGSGGGGAVLIASTTRIIVSGGIFARGGVFVNGPYNNGSGGAVRLVAPIVSGGGSINVLGGVDNNQSFGGAGRIRIDAIDRSTLGLVLQGPGTVGGFMAVFPSPLPRLDILQAADTVIPEGNPAPVQVLLPFGSTSNRTVTVQARDFNAAVPINVVLTPEVGLPRVYPMTIQNAASNPATATVNVILPANTVVTINAWTR